MSPHHREPDVPECVALSMCSDRAAPYPLREDPFFATRRRPTGVNRVLVGPSTGVDVEKQQRIAAHALVAQTDPRKFGLATVVVVVQVDQERRDALPAALDLARKRRCRGFLEIAVRSE